MTAALERISAKIARAKTHIEATEHAAAAYARTNPVTVALREDMQSKKRIYYVASITEVPLDLQTIAADAISNLRGALDHIAYQLELAACGSPPKHRVYFPIANSSIAFPTRRKECIRCAGQSVIDAIDAIEPYKDGKGHGLWQLNALNNTDKHHLLVATRAISMGVDILPTMVEGMPEWAREAWANTPPLFIREVGMPPLTQGDELFIEPLERRPNSNRQFAFDIAFALPDVVGDEPALKTLHRLSAVVDEVASALTPMLPHQAP